MDKQDFDRVISTAIGREIEANEFYADASAKTKDPVLKQTFSKLAGEEMGHMELLEKFWADPGMPFKIDAPKADLKVAEATELPRLSTSMKPADALALAMKKEQQAMEFYRGLSIASSDAGLKTTFDNLANMELGHKNRLETLFVDIGYPEAF